MSYMKNTDEDAASLGLAPTTSTPSTSDPVIDLGKIVDGWSRTPGAVIHQGLSDAVDRARAAALAQLEYHRRMNAPRPGINKDLALLLEAYRYGQFSDSMLDHPSPDCRAPAKPVREALRRVLGELDKASNQPQLYAGNQKFDEWRGF